MAAATGASLCAVTVGLVTPPVQAAAGDPTSASALAAALAADPGVVTGARFLAQPPSGGTALASSRPVSGFPHSGTDYALLSTGEATGLYPGTGSQNEDRGGLPVRGTSAVDVTVLQVDVQVPAGDNCLTGVDFRFLSDEYPDMVGQPVNDAFVMEIDHSTWTTAGSEITAPDNLALDEVGHPISINAAGAASMSTSLSIGTTTSGSTRTFRASAPVSPGAHRLYFSIFDQGDAIGDSDVLLDNLAFGHVNDPTTGCRPGISAPYGQALDAPAPTFDDAAGTYTIPDRAGVAYDVNLAPTGPGTHPSEAGTTMTVTAQPSGDDFLVGPSAWTHYVPQAERVPAWTEDPVFTDLPGAAQDTVSVPKTPGIVYALNGKPLTDAVTDAPASGDNTVTASAEPGFVIEGATSWRHSYDGGPGTYDVGNATRPTADLAHGTYTIPEDVSGRIFQIDGADVGPGTYPGWGTVEVNAAPGETGPRDADNRWSFTFPGNPFLDATAQAPTFTDSHDGHGAVTIPDVPGVTYRIDRRPTDPGGPYQESGPTTVTARPAADHGLEGPSAWSHTFTGVGSVPVTPVAPTFTDPAGAAADTVTVPAQVGVRYLWNGDVATAGVQQATEQAASLTAVAAAGFQLAGRSTTWNHTFERPALTPGTPTVSGVAVQGRTLTARPGSWGPGAVTTTFQWLRDGTPIGAATGATHQLTSADVGARLAVSVTGTREGYRSASRQSAATGAVRGLLTTSRPTVSGITRVGRILTVYVGRWSPSGVTFRYQWYRDGTAIRGATERTHLLRRADRGHRESVRVTGTRTGYVRAVTWSARTARIRR